MFLLDVRDDFEARLLRDWVDAEKAAPESPPRHSFIELPKGHAGNLPGVLAEQGDEVWTGTTYAFASNCILYGLLEEGMHTAYGGYYTVYSPYGQGYFFKTPEAYCNPDEKRWNDPEKVYGDRLFRAMKYMRPGAVWAVWEALKHYRKINIQ